MIAITKGIDHPRAASRSDGGFLQFRALRGKPDLCEAQKDEAKDGSGVFLGLETGIGSKLVAGVPAPFF
jgi:hypothetical protein